MNLQTKALMMISALFMAAAGVGLSFMPQEFLTHIKNPADGFAVAVVEVLGAMYLGFAMLNWTAKGILIGGIYARPVALGNLMHFAVAATILVKRMPESAPPVMLGIAGTYVVLAIWFGLVLFTHPAARHSEGA